MAKGIAFYMRWVLVAASFIPILEARKGARELGGEEDFYEARYGPCYKERLKYQQERCDSIFINKPEDCPPGCGNDVIRALRRCTRKHSEYYTNSTANEEKHICEIGVDSQSGGAHSLTATPMNTLPTIAIALSALLLWLISALVQ
ncbi:hypothetical protein CBR_g38991 [Chara braunii]|uniref:Uncharacterized protein n=1 Tax=Chara braunii TaxID=69332 RepID=A0A388K0W0_CHABU|nr:hypothetical protein CBR_g38991 [Chara braunii]|eukprot:GBG63679.1 hypothetical protein CBR_g38991 [Chara braunii]